MDYPLHGKEILVTGATGFIGSRVVQALVERGARVRAMARNPAKARGLESTGATVVTGDVTDAASLARAVKGCRTVFHFAGALNEFQPRAYFAQVNISGTRLMAESALREGVDRFIYVSTVWVYGLWAGAEVSESSPYRQSGHYYSDTKLEAERLVRRMIAEEKLPAVILQPSEVYGPGDPNWTERPLQLIKTGRMVLVDGGRGLTQPIFIDDLVRGVLAAAEKGRLGERYILCGPEAVTFREYFSFLAGMVGRGRLPSVPGRLALWSAALAEWAARMLKRPPVFTRQEIRAATTTATYDGRKAERELGFGPKASLAEGMLEVQNWLRKRK